MTNIILCGGSGTRLWPISRTLMPKQFVKLFDDKSLFQLTAKRNSKLCKNFYIIGSKNNLLVTHDKQIATIGVENLIIIDTPDALLISKKGNSQKVKEVVTKLKEKKSELINVHTLAHRP